MELHNSKPKSVLNSIEENILRRRKQNIEYSRRFRQKKKLELNQLSETVKSLKKENLQLKNEIKHLRLNREFLIVENKRLQEKHILSSQKNNDIIATCDNQEDVSTSPNDNILHDVMLSDSATNYHEVKHLCDDCIARDKNTATDKIFDDEFDKTSNGELYLEVMTLKMQETTELDKNVECMQYKHKKITSIRRKKIR